MKGGDLMVMVGEGLKKRRAGMPMGDEAPASERGEGEPAGDEREHLEDIAADMISAFKGGDPKALADLLLEAFECCSTYPEDEPAPEA